MIKIDEKYNKKSIFSTVNSIETFINPQPLILPRGWLKSGIDFHLN